MKTIFMTRLSSNFNFFFYLILIIVIILFAGWLNSIRLNINEIPKDGLYELPIFIVIGCIILYFIKKARKVYFDSDNLYITSSKNELTIPLVQITKVKMITIEIGDANFYKIEFKTSSDKVESIRLLPNEYFSDFLKIVQEKKKNTEIKHSAHSLDFDI